MAKAKYGTTFSENLNKLRKQKPSPEGEPEQDMNLPDVTTETENAASENTGKKSEKTDRSIPIMTSSDDFVYTDEETEQNRQKMNEQRNTVEQSSMPESDIGGQYKGIAGTLFSKSQVKHKKVSRSYTLDEDICSQLEDFAKRSNMSVSAVLNKILREVI